MSSWFSQFFSGKSGEPPPVPSPRPTSPYETIVDDGPGIGKRLFRPLVYVFEHRILPEAMKFNHPELKRALQPTQTLGASFRHMWSKSAVLCESTGLWPAGLTDDVDAFWRYAKPLADSVVCVPTRTDELTVWTMRTPKPVTIGETRFVALCRRHDDASEYGWPFPPPSHRYFTLEATFQQGEACFCEWTHNGLHVNLGNVPIPTSAGFANLVLERLASNCS